MAIGMPLRSACQNIQPLQAGAPWTAAPTLWIEPLWSSVIRWPSALTLANQRRRASNSTSPGRIRPSSISRPNGTLGCSRRLASASASGSSTASTSAIRALATAA